MNEAFNSNNLKCAVHYLISHNHHNTSIRKKKFEINYFTIIKPLAKNLLLYYESFL